MRVRLVRDDKGELRERYELSKCETAIRWGEVLILLSIPVAVMVVVILNQVGK